ncbi:hypothetical protein [Pseudomonas sp. zfem005]|uniref:hypothetical protein n=1 Tax=Pseudomonas sp. zfem005 TaxID=3078200 RepID=UPI00292916F6|nr:hypothetical protein [Pseudomonas sp. zfem005]MDU9415851.1 hypothetical protein [Pseudomonas sp. zfem005]
MSLDTCIVNAATAAWDQSYITGTQNKKNCSGFLQSVAATLGVPIPAGTADSIMGGLPQATGWKELASGDEAAQKASQGYFVIAGIKGSDHNPARNNGHVAVVIGGTLYRGKYPRVWCGSIAGSVGQSQGLRSVGEVWNRTDRDLVKYFVYATASCRG